MLKKYDESDKNKSNNFYSQFFFQLCHQIESFICQVNIYKKIYFQFIKILRFISININQMDSPRNTQDIEKKLKQFLQEQFVDDFESTNEMNEETDQIINQLKKSEDLQKSFEQILKENGRKGTELKLTLKEFKQTPFYLRRIQLQNNIQITPTIDNYENQINLLRQLFSDKRRIVESNINTQFHQYKLYEIILESLVTKYDVLKEEFKNLTNREARSSNTIKQILKEIEPQIEKQGRINNQIIKCIIDIQNNKGSLLDHLMTIKKQLNPIDVMDLQRLIQKNKNAEAELKDKSIILFIGDTGSGKTTTILSLLGFRMTKKKLKGMTWVTTTQRLTDQKLKLLHSSPELKSITRYPLAVLPKERLDQNEQIWFVDTPGFGDSAGTEVDLANGIGTIKAIKGCKNVRIAIVISKQSWGTRGKGIRSLAKLLGDIFNNYQKVKNSVIYIFNRFTVDEIKELHSAIENLLQNLNEEDRTNQNLMSLYVDLLTKTQNHLDIINFDPLIQDQYKKVSKKILKLKTLNNPSEAFSFSFTQKTLSNIKQQCSIFENIIRYYYQQRNYQIVRYYYKNYKLFNQLVDRQDIENGFTIITNYLQNLVKQYFDLAQLKFNDRLSRNFLTKEDITSYQQKIKQAEKYKCLQDCIKIIRKEDLELNLVNQVSSLIERILLKEYFQKQVLDSILFLNQHFKIEGYKQLLQKIDNKINECKKIISKSFEDRNYQQCAENLNILRVKLELKNQIKNFSYEKEFQKILSEIVSKILKWSQEYLQKFKNLDLNMIQKMNELEKNLNDVKICYPLMKILDKEAGKILEQIQMIKSTVLEKVNKQCKQLNQLLDEKNIEGIQNKISQKFKTLQIYKPLNCASSEIKLKLNTINERIKTYLNIQTDTLCQFCSIIENKSYHQNNLKLKLLLAKLDITIQGITNFLPFRNDQQKTKQYKELSERTLKNLNQYFIDQESFISELRITNNMDNQQIILVVNSLKGIIEQIKILEKCKNIFEIKLLVQLRSKLKAFFNTVLQSSKKTLNGFRLAIKKSTSLKLVKIENEFNFLSIFSETTLKVQSQELSQGYQIELKNLKEQITKKILQNLQTLNKDNLEDEMIYTLTRDIKKHFEYIVVLKTSCPNICQVCFQDDIERFYSDVLTLLYKRYQTYQNSWNICKNQNNNFTLNKLIILCTNHLIFDKYMDENHKFEKLEQEIKKSIQKNFSRTVSQINNYFIKNDFLNLKGIFQRLSNDKSYTGQKSYREGQQFLITKIKETFNSLPKMQTQFQQNKQEFSLTSQEIAKLQSIFNIKNYVGQSIKDFKQYKQLQKNTKSISTLIKKLLEQNITKIKANIDNYELEEALLGCENLKKIEAILIIISEKQKNQIQEHQKLLKQINIKIEEIEKVYLKNPIKRITKDFSNIYRITLETATTNKIKKLKDQIDNKIKIYFQQMMKSFYQQSDLEKQEKKKAEIKIQLNKLPISLEHLQQSIFNNYLTQVVKNQNQIQKDLNILFKQGNQESIYNKLKHFQKVKNTKCINMIVQRYENNLKIILQKLTENKSLKENLNAIETILQLWKFYEHHQKIAQLSKNSIQSIKNMSQQSINITIKKFWEFYKNEQFNQIQLLLKSIFETSKKFKSVIEVLPILKYMDQKFKNILTLVQNDITICLENLKLQEIFEEDKITKQVVQSLNKLFQYKDIYFILTQNIDEVSDIQPASFSTLKSKDNINSLIQRFLAKINEVNIFLQQFSFNKLLYDKNAKAVELKKLKINLLILKVYGGIYQELQKQQIKKEQFYTKKIQNQIEQVFTECKRIIATIQILKTESQYEKLNHQIEILQKYEEIFNINKFISTIKKNLEEKIKSASDQVPKLVNDILQIFKSDHKKNQPITSSAQDQIRSRYKKKITQKKQYRENRMKNSSNLIQKQQIELKLTTQISDLQKQQNQQIKKIRDQQFLILDNKIQLYEQRKTEKNFLIAHALIFIKSLEIYITIVKENCKAQIAKIIKLYGSKLQKNNFKNLATAIQNKNGLSSNCLLSQLPEFQKIVFKNNKKFQLKKIDEVLKNCIFIKNIQSMKKLYESYKSQYSKLLQEYYNSKQPNIDKIIGNMKTKASVLKDHYKYPSKNNDGNLLIAYIVSIWLIINSIQIQNKIEYRFIPHPAQIIAVFYLLGIGDSASKYSITNRVAEIEAGEGKSLILAIVASYLGLLGYQVNIVCQTDDLCLRGWKAFKQLYTKIGIDQSIRYATINNTIRQNLISPNLSLINQEIQQLNKNIANKFLGWLSFGDKKKQKVELKQKILLIDETNTIFQSNFYTGVYRPYIIFNHVCIQNLFTYIWTNKYRISIQQIEKNQSFQACKKVFPYLELILKNHIRDMLYCAKNWEHSYFVIEGKIAYVKQSIVTSELLYGYKSCFAYCNQASRNKITQNTKNQNLILMVTYDQLLYSDLLNNFKYTLGVTQCFNQVKSLDKFNKINEYELIPSSYKQSNRIQKPIILTTKDLFYQQIVKQINSILTQNRSVLLFFSNQFEANHFFYSQKCSDLREKYNNLLFENLFQDQKNFRISKSTKQGMVTILTPFFAKGTDFIINDQQLLQNGGLHVIQTFLSTSIIEQMQIKGRCARQGDKGSYRLILVEEQLQKLKISLEVNQLKKQKLKAQQNQSLVTLINDKRVTYLEKYYANLNIVRNNQQKSAKQRIIKAKKIFQKLERYNIFTPIFNNQYRIVLGLDVTGSMSYTLEQIKRILPSFIQNLVKILNSLNFNLALQIFVYRNYGDHAPFLIHKSSLQTKPELLLNFLNKITATGGYGSTQAIQLFYHHLNQLFFNQAILIGGAQENTAQQIIKKRDYFGQNYWVKNSINKVFGHQQLQKIKQKRLPIHCIPTVTDKSVKQYFRRISDSTRGKFMDNYTDTYSSDNLLITFLTSCIQQNLKGYVNNKYNYLE